MISASSDISNHLLVLTVFHLVQVKQCIGTSIQFPIPLHPVLRNNLHLLIGSEQILLHQLHVAFCSVTVTLPK